ncbi:DUF4912 domain-containing protein [Paenibacillus aestuarii]|uniref:DUF4912 domain-containing protein n=1 Tax=Paenibacillus aestuarii TaxID=516965 RepID=A0ABW0KA43_9BACL|nr:DUF4912 domain-containing protein [Paenibacillus aestuarii]
MGFDLPDRYHQDLIHLMTIDAHTLYVYWEISDRRRWLVAQHFQCDYGDMPKVLRVYDVTCTLFDGSNAHAYWDIELSAEVIDWYIRDLGPGRTYIADIGTYTWDREFIPLLRSNCAATPRNTSAVSPQLFEQLEAYSPSMR